MVWPDRDLRGTGHVRPVSAAEPEKLALPNHFNPRPTAQITKCKIPGSPPADSDIPDAQTNAIDGERRKEHTAPGYELRFKVPGRTAGMHRAHSIMRIVVTRQHS